MDKQTIVQLIELQVERRLNSRETEIVLQHRMLCGNATVRCTLLMWLIMLTGGLWAVKQGRVSLGQYINFVAGPLLSMALVPAPFHDLVSNDKGG